MNLWLITIKYGGNESEVYIPATSADEAIKIAKSRMTGQVRRWATVFA